MSREEEEGSLIDPYLIESDNRRQALRLDNGQIIAEIRTAYANGALLFTKEAIRHLDSQLRAHYAEGRTEGTVWIQDLQNHAVPWPILTGQPSSDNEQPDPNRASL